MNSYLYELSYPQFYPKRRGVIIDWGDGRWGEAAPLQGWNKESIEDVVTALNTQTALPSLGFARDARPFSQLSLPICGLLSGNKEEIIIHANTLHNQGVRYAKLKVKGISLEEAIELTNMLSEKLRLRIDFNRSLSLEEALFFANNINLNSIEFFEEPLKNPKDLYYFPYPVALDESLREEEHQNLTSLEQVVALVIKPTMTGGIAECKRFAHLKKPIVLSSSFESGIGILQIMYLASTFGNLLAPLGIDTYRYLEEDLLEKPLIFEGGYVHTPKTFAIKQRMLKRI